MSYRGGNDRSRGGSGRGGSRGGNFQGPPRGGASYGGGDRGGGGQRRGRGGGSSSGSGSGQSYSSGPPQVHANVDGSITALDSRVEKAEAAYEKNIASGGSGSLGLETLQLDTRFPRRPGYGTKGKPVILWANYFEMVASPDLILYRYSVAVKPEAKGRKLKRVIELLLQSPAYNGFRNDIVTDFSQVLISRKKLGTDTAEVALKYRAEDEDEPLPNADNYELLVEQTASFPISELLDYINSTNSIYADRLSMITALNVFLGHYAKASPGITTVGSSKAYSLSGDAGGLGSGLLALRGFFSSIRLATCRILVNVNVSHGAFYDPLPLDELMAKVRLLNQRVKLQEFLRRVRVRTTHLPEKKNKAGIIIARIKTIFRLANRDDGHNQAYPPRVRAFAAGPKEVEFYLENTGSSTSSSSAGPAAAAGKAKGKSKGRSPRDGGSGQAPHPSASQGGRYISVFDFFRTVYGKSNLNPDLPVVNVGNRENPSYLPAEVCEVLPGQPRNSKLDPAQTAQMINFAVRQPGRNAASITKEGIETVGLMPSVNPFLRSFNISVSKDLITVIGRILSGPKVLYKQEKQADIRAASWNLYGGIRFHTAKTLPKWTHLEISMGQDGPDDLRNAVRIDKTMEKFQNSLQAVGINKGEKIHGKFLHLEDPSDSQLEATFRLAADNGIRLLFIVLPSANTQLYNQVKHVGDVKIGIHTICVVRSKFTKENGQNQYFANVQLKLNLKIGGINHVVESTRLGIIGEDKTMVVGIDVTHPSPGSVQNAPSIAGMVASVDKLLGQWPAALRVQTSKQEMVSDLDSMLKSRLQLWKSRGGHKEFPDNILVYRDGVSEGQYDIVLDTELPLLRKACKEVYPAQDTKKGLPKITIIVVGKRHHTRFYPTKLQDASISQNTQNGTVVDRGVTEARNWDFFLQAHHAIKGTARPAHYYIVHDEIFPKRKVPPHLGNTANKADMLEDLTHSMSYLFGRATKAVSICPPAYYADILCERARCYLAGLFDVSTPAQSSSGQSGGQLATMEDVTIHQNLKDTMFYI